MFLNQITNGMFDRFYRKRNVRDISMGNVNEAIKALKSTCKHIKAYEKIGTDELIVEAEKCYVYKQYDLANEICNVILEDKDGRYYSSNSCVRAFELRALLLYYHEEDLYGRHANIEEQAFEILQYLDSKGWEILDSRYLLGKLYADRGYYERAMRSFTMWMTNRDKESAKKAFVEMFKRGQYDTDTQYNMLFSMYYAYFMHSNIEDLLLRSAKYVEEYFPQYIHESVGEKLGLPVKQVSKIHYTDDDFVLPYSLRCFDCANYIRQYVRSVKKPTLSGCMQYLANEKIQLDIENRTIQATKKELEEALIRNQINNEKTKLDIMRQEAMENAKRYNHLKQEMEKHNKQMREYQEESLRNQEKSLEEQRKIRRAINNVESAVRLSRF